MKTDTHPTYYTNALVTCSCGNKIKVGSTVEKLNVEICSACHPFFTGEKKIIDTAGRVERFRQRSAKANTKKPKTITKKAKVGA
ncbi:MAG: 50S ribosomal protein L31 [Parcubacteria group bacterium RIFCSPHIGHO2_01_FULL_45_26]|nr:MAG: 50S ribosomal protein L31 [Parcubacteria group bacterium RIFCSPHIGHO2_01_FULL_45_26]